MDRLRQFLDSAANSNRGRPKIGWRYSQEQRNLAITHCCERREEGRSYAKIAEELGISPLTLSRWRRTEPTAAPPSQDAALAAGFKQIKVVDAFDGAAVQGLVAITPSGLRIEGLGWGQVIELMEIYR